jgi:Short C-terminal domain
MARQQPIRVVVERKGGCMSGCGTALAAMLLLGLTIQYWYVALPIVAIVAVAAISSTKTQRKKAAHEPGPRDPWLNEVAVALADLGLKEIARNTGAQLGGAPIDGDIGLQADRFLVYVTLFSDQRLARQAELGLRAKPDVRDAIAKGATAVRTADRVVFVASGRGAVVDEFRLDEVVRVVGPLAVPPPLQVVPTASLSGAASPAPSADVLEQLRRLGELRTAGVLTDAEFEAKKAELLGRL